MQSVSSFMSPYDRETTYAHWLSSRHLSFGFLQKPLFDFLIQTLFSWRAEKETKIKWGLMGLIQFPDNKCYPLFQGVCSRAVCAATLKKWQWIRVACKDNVAWFADSTHAYFCKYFSIFQNWRVLVKVKIASSAQVFHSQQENILKECSHSNLIHFNFFKLSIPRPERVTP